MIFKLMQPGIYRGVMAADYFADPCPTPSFTQSLAKTILDRSPAHARLEHPRLTPIKPEDEPAEKYVAAQAIGNAAHALLIGRGKELATLDFDNFMTKDAKKARDEAVAAGQTPILFKHKQIAADMVLAAKLQMTDHPAAPLFAQGAGEVVIAWQEDGLWFRQMLDWLHDDLLAVDDFKSSGMSCAPHAIPTLMANAGWSIQAAMAERGLNVLDPSGAGKRRYRFIAQENDLPYALTVCELPESTLILGRKKLQHAVDIWRRCMETGHWPAYPAETLYPEYPGWAESQWLNREISEAARDRIPQRREPMLTNLAGG